MAKAKTRLGKATFVSKGYGQVEPNHLSAPQNGQVYAQLPAAASIDMLENGQFVKYDMAAGVVGFTGMGPWRMVFNEVKVYEDGQGDADFAMVKDNYEARVYSPIGQHSSNVVGVADGKHVETFNYPEMMPTGTTMVPRVIAITPGDWWTTNTIMAAPGSLSVGDMLQIGKDGYLAKVESTVASEPVFQVVKVFTMPDLQPGVKVQCVG